MKTFLRLFFIQLVFCLTTVSIFPGIAFSDFSTQFANRKVIGHLCARNSIITVSVGVDGPVYTVKKIGGGILAVDLPSAELFARFPDLRQAIERGVAGNDASLGPVSQSPLLWQR